MLPYNHSKNQTAIRFSKALILGHAVQTNETTGAKRRSNLFEARPDIERPREVAARRWRAFSNDRSEAEIEPVRSPTGFERSKGRGTCPSLLISRTSTRGFEPPTYRLGGGRSIQLSYADVLRAMRATFTISQFALLGNNLYGATVTSQVADLPPSALVRVIVTCPGFFAVIRP